MVWHLQLSTYRETLHEALRISVKWRTCLGQTAGSGCLIISYACLIWQSVSMKMIIFKIKAYKRALKVRQQAGVAVSLQTHCPQFFGIFMLTLQLLPQIMLFAVIRYIFLAT